MLGRQRVQQPDLPARRGAWALAAVLSLVIPGLPEIPVALAVIAACTLVGLFDIRINALITGCFLLAGGAGADHRRVARFGDAIRSPLNS
jgi:hypothetical protein